MDGRPKSGRNRRSPVRTRMDEDSGRNHCAKAWYWFSTKVFIVITKSEDARKGVATPKVNTNTFSSVDVMLPGMIAMRMADEKMGRTQGAAMSVYMKPRMKAPT